MPIHMESGYKRLLADYKIKTVLKKDMTWYRIKDVVNLTGLAYSTVSKILRRFWESEDVEKMVSDGFKRNNYYRWKGR